MLERAPEVVADEGTSSPAPRKARRARRSKAAEKQMAAEDTSNPDPTAPSGEGDDGASGGVPGGANGEPASTGKKRARRGKRRKRDSGPDPEPGAEASAPAEDAPAEGEAADASPAAEDAAPAKLGPGEELSDEELERRLSALLFASPEPLGIGRLANLLENPAPQRVRALLDAVSARLEASGLPVELREIAGGYQLLSTPDVYETVGRLAKVRREEKVSPAALETLAVVAYRQPVTKAEIEAIRGVQVGPILRALVDRRLVRVTGRAEVPGQPLLYGTTKRFLETFGLAGLKQLPRDSELVRD